VSRLPGPSHQQGAACLAARARTFEEKRFKKVRFKKTVSG
jgi:hypothetical protein